MRQNSHPPIYELGKASTKNKKEKLKLINLFFMVELLRSFTFFLYEEVNRMNRIALWLTEVMVIKERRKQDSTLMRVNEWIREWKSLQWDKEKLWESPCIGLWLNEVKGRMWFCHLLGGKAAEDWMDSPWLNKVKHILSPEPFLFRYDLTFFHSKKRRKKKESLWPDLIELGNL